MALFGGISNRIRISLAREWELQVIHIASGQPYSETVDCRMAAGAAVFLPTTMTGTHLVIYSAIEEDNAYWPVYNENALLAVITVGANRVVTLPSNIFPLGFIRLASASNATGTLANEGAERTMVMVLKP